MIMSKTICCLFANPVSIAAACCLSLGIAAFAQDAATQNPSNAQYTNKIEPTYNYRFGKKHPFAPGDAELAGGGFIRPGAFPDARYCAHCHKEAYHQWRHALHSNSFRDPFYRASVNILIRTKGIEYSRHCDSCHNPVAVLSGALTEDSQVNRGFDDDGLNCMVCHSIQALKSTSGNGGFVMGVPAVITDAKGNRIPGEVPYQEIMDHTDRHVRAVMQDFYHSSTFCAACHKADLPQPLNDFKFISAFSTYDEWQNSRFSHQSPLTFYSGPKKTCQDCHMKRAPNKLLDYGAKNGMFASHRWLAGNTAVPFYYGFKNQLDKTIAFLQSGKYLHIDLFGLKPANQDSVIGPLGAVPFRIEPGETLDAYVVIQNKDIGHSFIPEIRDLYQAWVEFSVKDARGKVICQSGFLNPDGSLDPSAHSFTNRPVDKDGEFVDNHEVWRIHSVAYDNTIQSGQSTLVRYRFRVPSDVTGPIRISVKVNYRHFRKSYVDNVFGKDHPAYPVVQIASAARELKIGENQPAPRLPNEEPDWMRWNNLGIAYLNEVQYGAAVDAFSKVVRLRPSDPDGYTNIAVTEIEWEKYASAEASIQKALSLSPKNARALYYRALLERRASQPEKELADLLEVARQYPQSRDARRELGVNYYRLGDEAKAVQQFEALQAIDPDDLAAHYNLSILYHRMGLTKQAEAQQALFVTEKINSTARSLSFAYLQNNPTASLESIPWHLHNLVPSSNTTNASSNPAGRMPQKAAQ